jgi:hypothetical protein
MINLINFQILKVCSIYRTKIHTFLIFACFKYKKMLD